MTSRNYYKNKFEWVWRVILIKFFTIFVVTYLIKLFNITDLFAYSDFEGYSRGEYKYPNFLYGVFVYFFDFSSLSDVRLIFAGVLSAVIIDLLTLNLFSKYFRINNRTIFYYFIFSLHPYFSLYSIRFDTLDFASLACILFLMMIHGRKRKKHIFYGLMFLLILSMFRISSLIFLFSTIISTYILKYKPKITRIEILNLILIIILSIFILNQNGISYWNSIINGPKVYGLNLESTRSFFGDFGDFTNVIIFYATKFVTLLGGREALYTEGIDYIYNSRLGFLQLVVFVCLASIHMCCIIYFLIFSHKRQNLIAILISLFMLAAALFTVGHMRYMLPYQSMLLIGFLYFTEKKYWKKLH